MKKNVKWGVVVGIFAVAIVAGILYLQPKSNSELDAKGPQGKVGAPGGKGGKGEKGGRGGGPLNVNAMIVKSKALTDEFSTTGLILPDEEVDLSFETSGKIVNISFKEGSVVHKGQLLAKVNDKPLQAQLKKLNAQLELAKNRVSRQEHLFQSEASSREALEEARTNLATLEAEIEAVKVNISLTELRAPFDGVLGLRQVSVGAYATPSVVVAKLAIQNRKLKLEQLQLDLRAELTNCWDAYRNDLELLNIQRENLKIANDNFKSSMERYKIGNMSGFDMRQVQKSLQDAEEKVLQAEYNAKICEISLLLISGDISTYLSEK